MTHHAPDWLDKYGDALYAYALRQLRDPHLAEEAVQNTLLAALEQADRFQGNASVRTWLTGILKHKLVDLLRDQQRWQALPDDDAGVDEDDLFTQSGRWREPPADWPDPARLLDQKQLNSLLEACLARLPRRVAQLLWLRELHDEPAESVCQSLGLTSANLYQLLFRARQSLRVCLGEGGRG